MHKSAYGTRRICTRCLGAFLQQKDEEICSFCELDTKEIVPIRHVQPKMPISEIKARFRERKRMEKLQKQNV